ncbi:hypothetical protein [Roseibium polysiphoniae]|uniref:Capsular polysaccharide export protein n=1 Tax=Roseibium polysiphoniae TaxID=2571221 RepID=A0ABR9C5I1_9HYPH|nr:hypothetical protein [Roseibium polysiphoniae]MBD8875159.1 hypothetical protein [Roseibium polysiphoniae]
MNHEPKVIDPALKPFKPKFAGLDGLLIGPDEALYQRHRKNVADGARQLTVILPGPFAIDEKFFPASLVHIGISAKTAKDLESFEGAVIASLLTEDGSSDVSAGKMLLRWRENISDLDNGILSDPESENATLRSLLNGDQPKAGTLQPKGFWARWAAAVEDQGEDLDKYLGNLLKHHCRWFEPYDGSRCSFENMLSVAGMMQESWNANDVPSHCYGAQYWNHPAINATFKGTGGGVSFHDSDAETLAEASKTGGRVLSWAGRTRPEFELACRDAQVQLLRIEDGFLRSVGLGAGLAKGAALAMDDTGIYYDPSRPSRLETLLETYEVSPEEWERGATLIKAMIAARVSKYNFGKARRFKFPKDKQLVLVPGQVADDAAVRKSKSTTIDCANTPNVNRDLLRIARERWPAAHIVFKPHPDVETGLRKGKLETHEVLQHADEIARHADIIDLIEAVDRIETFSSLSGFEALIRGKDVTVHGLPFYAGWGLSEDLTQSERRTRERSIEEVVYLALCVYSRTIDPVTLLPCTPEFLIERLAGLRRNRWHVFKANFLRRASWLGRKIGL